MFFLIAVGILLSVSRTPSARRKNCAPVLGRECRRKNASVSNTKRKRAWSARSAVPEKRTVSRALIIMLRRVLAPKPKKQAPKRPRPEPSLDYPRIERPSSSSFSSGGFKRTRAYLEERERYSS